MKHRLLALMCLGAIILTACKGEPSESLQDKENGGDLFPTESYANPFTENEDSNIIGSLHHGFASNEIDENNQIIPIYYNGLELCIEYKVTASGTAKNVGFIIFVDGEPQLYKTSLDGEYSYMSAINLKEDNVSENFSFIFTPSIGKQGEILSLYVMSIYNPNFKPDMISSSNYGMYHSELSAYQNIVFNTDVESPSRNLDQINDLLISSEYLADDIMQKIQSTSMFSLTDEQLNNHVHTTTFYNDENILNSNLSYDRESINVEYMIYGVPTANYKTTFFLNHEPISDSYETVLQKGKLAVISFDIDPSILSGMDTFYAISVPTNELDFKDELVNLKKSQSILLYKYSESN